MENLSEKETRKILIDKQLRESDWNESSIKKEVNIVKSDLKNKKYILFKGKIEKGVDAFVDYLLLNENDEVLAIIEAKKLGKDLETGSIQARSYVNIIEEKLDYKIPRFLSDGNVWKLIDEFRIERKISGVFSQKDLENRNHLYKNLKNITTINVDKNIVDRPQSIKIVKKVAEHLSKTSKSFSKGNRYALINMATGTGKTRVAIALTKLLIEASYVKNVLFIADRVVLSNQAFNGFTKFLSSYPISNVREDREFDDSKRIFVSTIQTLKGKGRKELYKKISPGFFDLIILDESHRSYYDKQGIVLNYFDAIKIGLTATPEVYEDRNTYKLFKCENNKPTVLYSYENGQIDGVLVPYRGIIIETKVLSLGIKGWELTNDLKLDLSRQELNPEETEFSGGQFARAFMDDKTNELIVREFMKYCYKDEAGKPSKTIFFCVNKKHAQRISEIFKKLYPNLSNDVQVIVSDYYRSSDGVKEFKNNSSPRIAISVGMLETGVDIPEVSNLVFTRPVFSHSRFWQMIGRGTRNFKSCEKNPKTLPNGDKKDFLVFDFVVGGHSNIKYHKLKEDSNYIPFEDNNTKIFKNRLKILEHKKLKADNRKIIEKKVLDDIESLDINSFIVREKIPLINRLKQKKFNLSDYLKELREEISPLIFIKETSGVYVTSFILKNEKLFNLLLDERLDKIEKIKRYNKRVLEPIKSKSGRISFIKRKEKGLLMVLGDEFWDNLSFESVEFLIKEISPLMRFYIPPEKNLIQVNAEDETIGRELLDADKLIDKDLEKFSDENNIVKKIKESGEISVSDLINLNRDLHDLNPNFSIENVQKNQKIDFLVFLFRIIGLSWDYDPKILIEREFEKKIIEEKNYNSKQISFLDFLKKIFSKKKNILVSDFGTSPLSDDPNISQFNVSELKEIVNSIKKIKIKIK